MHILSFLMVLVILTLALSVIGAMIAQNGARIAAALAGPKPVMRFTYTAKVRQLRPANDTRAASTLLRLAA